MLYPFRLCILAVGDWRSAYRTIKKIYPEVIAGDITGLLVDVDAPK